MKCYCGMKMQYSTEYKILFCSSCGKREGMYSAIARNISNIDSVQANQWLAEEKTKIYQKRK